MRPIPVLAWTGGACILAVGLALGSGADLSIGHLSRLLLIAILLQGWLAHSLNDRVDWVSGTDRVAANKWSGGSGALSLGYLHQWHLLPIAAGSLLLVLALAYQRATSPITYLYLAIGLWGAITYSCAPWRFAYLPLAGEWLAAFPAIVACTLAFYQALQGSAGFTPLAASCLHGLFSISWLMQHHLPDWQHDLQATPPKRTTVAYVANKHGLQIARLVVVIYFLMTAIIAFVFSIFIKCLIWAGWLAALCAVLAYRQNTDKKHEMARRELQMVGLILINAFILGWLP